MNQIYLDIDGVLNTWLISEVSRRVGWNVQHSDWPVDIGWNIVEVTNGFLPYCIPMSRRFFWSTVPESSWSECPVSELFHMLLNLCPAMVGRQNVHVVTSLPPFRCPLAASGKVKWCEANLPEWLLPNIIMVNGGKERLAQPGRLLIDDANHNVDPWIDAGGEAILVPRPWNRAHKVDTEAFVRQHLKDWPTWRQNMKHMEDCY